MAAGTLVPFFRQIGLPGTTFDIDLNCTVMTHPTIGPLFGRYRIQLDVFTADMRLYQGKLHNNKLKIGLDMKNVFMPVMELFMDGSAALPDGNIDNIQINPSCILSYLGIRGVGTTSVPDAGMLGRKFNANYLLMYWDVYKNYYANKSEEIGYVIHKALQVAETIDSVELDNGDATATLPKGSNTASFSMRTQGIISINYTGAPPILTTVLFYTNRGVFNGVQIMGNGTMEDDGAGGITIYLGTNMIPIVIKGWDYIGENQLPITPPQLWEFPLSNIDDMREYLLTQITTPGAVNIGNANLTPYDYILNPWNATTDRNPYLNNQEGLAIKTYQSDLFNNWLNTEWMDGAGGINELTAIDTSGGNFQIDTLIFAKKLYNVMNRIAVSGGSYDDFLDATYSEMRYSKPETPVYHGSLIKELTFDEVISNSQSTTESGTQPLGTLAGRGVMTGKHKGGSMTIKCSEPTMVMGIISITPIIDYSQGNDWDVHVQTMDDWHKPGLDGIGFQELITEQMHWGTTVWNGTEWVTKSAGKQPAWVNYMTAIPEVRGNFAVQDNEMFMVLNRRYEYDKAARDIKDLTSYVDPVKYNNIFAETSLDAQNFWVQVAVGCTSRRKMSAKIMPNL